MKDIGLYIIEKLRLDKDIKAIVSKEPHEGDKAFCVSINIHRKTLHVSIHHPMTIENITSKNIEYKKSLNGTITHDFYKDYFINSNGFYEIKPSGNVSYVCMSRSFGLEFVQTILDKDITKELLYKYFDEEDEWIDDYPIVVLYTDVDARKILDELSKLDTTVSEKLHLDKDIKITDNNIVNDILDLCSIKKPKYSEKNYETIKWQLEKWVRKNNVNSVNMYVQETYESKKYMSKLDKEIADKAKVIGFGDFYKLFTDPFPEGTNFDEIDLYKHGNIDIYGNEKALTVNTQNFLLLIINVK